jgi:hypothetical protein
MEVLGIVIAALGTVVIVYLVVYTIPSLVMRAVRAGKRRRAARTNANGPERAETYEIYISLRAA